MTTNLYIIKNKCLHKLTLWTMFLCSKNTLDCINAKDSLSIRVGKDSTPNVNFTEVYRKGSEFGRYLDNRWI